MITTRKRIPHRDLIGLLVHRHQSAPARCPVCAAANEEHNTAKPTAMAALAQEFICPMPHLLSWYSRHPPHLLPPTHSCAFQFGVACLAGQLACGHADRIPKSKDPRSPRAKAHLQILDETGLVAVAYSYRFELLSLSTTFCLKRTGSSAT